jgi:urease accessory protein
VSCAIKLVPLGQSAGQRILSALVPVVDRAVQTVLEIEDHQIGSFTPRLALGSALHETQYTRLFRS